MRLKRWVVVLAMVLALGCGEEKRSVGGNDGRDIELEAPLNATPAGSEAGNQNARSSARKADCRIETEKLCKWRSDQSPTAHTQQQLDECIVRQIAKCEEGGQ
jgi:hypothetical protein